MLLAIKNHAMTLGAFLDREDEGTGQDLEENGNYEEALMEKCVELTTITERGLHTEDEQVLMSMKSYINETLTSVGQSFSQMIELALTHEIQRLVRQLESSNNIYSIGTAMSSLLSLTQEGAHLCYIIAKEGGVVALFKICRQDYFSCLHAQALKTLASICSVEEGIDQLEKVDGILCLADILTDVSNPEATRAEAAAVVAQITSPHLTFSQHLSSFLENMEDIVTALIRFLIETQLSTSQVVTILANMAVLDQCASEVLQENGVQLLLEMLYQKSHSENVSEAAACERVQQKSAVTLARLSRDPDVAHAAVKLQCIPRLIELCRLPTERNNSDSVLVACLAALRRLAVACPESFEDADVQPLIKPRLVDSFLLCTSMEESFV
nr:PREDICTED: protein inscuteable homolog [Latimeria chalumnae]|eukprot:XP_005989761.1 PREDICTED: protein inscuteable homolog [Latimeria chalumnae]